MKPLLFAIASLALVASARPVERSAAAMEAARKAVACPSPDRLPFPLPSTELSSDWGDAAFELWERNAWEVYCTGRQSSHACRCARLNGGGAY